MLKEKYYVLEPDVGALRDCIVNNKSKGRDSPLVDVTVRVFVGENIAHEIEDKLVQVEIDV